MLLESLLEMAIFANYEEGRCLNTTVVTVALLLHAPR